MTDRRPLTRTLFVALSLLAFASARCAQQRDAPPGAEAVEAGGTPDSPSDAATGATDDAAEGGAACSSDINSDPKNCGRCGHDCLGGGCSGGTCQPIVLAADQLAPSEIAIDATHVYFAASAGNAVLRVPLAGGPVETLAQDNGVSSNIAVDDGFVYYMTFFGIGGQICRVPKTGAADAGPEVLAATGNYGMPFIAADDANIYWTTGRFAGTTQSGSLYSVAKIGGSVVKLNVATSAPTTSVAADDTNIYFANAQGRMLAVSKTGTVTLLGLSQAGATGLLADGKKVYWANSGAGSIKAIDKPVGGSAGTPAAQVLAGGQNEPLRIAKDDVAIYFTNRGNGTIASCPLSGCADVARVVASDQSAPVGIAVDAVAIYWGNSGNGTVMKVAK